MKMKTLLVSFGFSLAAAAVCLASDDQALRDLDEQWAAAAGAKDLDKTLSYYSDDAIVLPPNAPAAMTKDAIRKAWKDMFDLPGFALIWQTTKVEMSKAGDMAYVIGAYEMQINDVREHPRKDHGKYLEVFKKQADGKWKCAADMFSSDLPALARE